MIHSQRMGTAGALPAVLAHCFLGQGSGWARLIGALRHPLDAVAIDLPGHGRSAPPQRDMHAEATDEVLRLSGQAGGPVLLIGHSFGATVVLRAALREPGRVAGLVLIEPPLFAAARGSAVFGRFAAEQAPIDAALARGDAEAALALFLDYNANGAEALPERMRAAMLAQMGLMAATGPVLADDAAGLLAPGRLEGLHSPVLMLAGADTRPIFPAVLRALAPRLPRAEFDLIPGAAHMAPVTHPQAVADRIDAWIARHGLSEPA